MSVEVLLIPAALGVAAWRARKDNAGDSKAIEVTTRLKDDALLREALAALGASVEGNDEVTIARWPEYSISFAPGADGIQHAYCREHGREDEVLSRIAELDGTYARLVQRDVVDRIRERAGQMGLRLDSIDVNDDDSVSLALEVLR